MTYARVHGVRLMYEQYGRVLGERAKAGQEYWRLVWWRTLAVSLLFAIIVGTGVYLSFEPTLRDIRRQRVLTQSDLDKERNFTTTELERLKSLLEQKILAIQQR